MKRRQVTRRLREALRRQVRRSCRLFAFVVLASLAAQSPRAATIDLSSERKEPTGDYNVRMGSLRLAFTGTFEVGYNDNITQAPNKAHGNDAEIHSGFYTQPGINMSVAWPLTPHISINSGVGLAYRYYPSESDFSDFIVSSDSGLMSARADLNLKLGQTGTVILAEEFSRTIDSLDIATSPERADTRGDSYAKNKNELSLQYNGDLNQYDHLIARYAHETVWVEPTQFQYEDYQSDTVDVVLLHELNRNLRLGPYFTPTYTYYSKPNPDSGMKRNDNMAYRLGLATVFNAGAGLTAELRLGWEFVDFANDNPVPTQENTSGLTASLQVNFMTSQHLRHTVFMTYGSSQSSLADDVNYSDDFQTGYMAMWHMTKEIYLRGDAAYLNRRNSENGERTDLIRVGIGPGWQLAQRTSIDIHYQYTTMWTGTGDSDYDQNLITMTLTHHF